MFVLNAEIRKWGNEPLQFFEFNHYIHPDVAGSGFEPKGDGSTLGGDVAGPSLVTIDHVVKLRDWLRFNNNSLWDLYGDESSMGSFSRQIMGESWYTTSYPGHGSGFIVITDLGFGFSIGNAIPLRPELEDITGGDDHIDTDIHWLAGSGVFFDLDIGEVVFQPFPFHSRFNLFRAGGGGVPGFGNPRFSFGPYFPSFQKTDGSIISLGGNEFAQAGAGSWRALTNFAAIASGKVQVDGYAMLPDTQLRLISGNKNLSTFGDTISATSDFTFFEGGHREINNAGTNDPAARTYWTPQAQASGFYASLPYTPLSAQPLLAIPSGAAGMFPQIDHRQAMTNRGLHRAINVTSDGKVLIANVNGASQGYQVFDDAIWMKSLSRNPLSGVSNSPSRGILPLSPFNGSFMWYRPADLTIASTGTNPSLSSQYDSGVPTGTPGNFECHVGMEPIGGDDILMLSKVYNQVFTDLGVGVGDQWDNEVFFQRYSGPSMTHSEISVSWTFVGADDTESGPVDNAISDMFYDGTDYWLVGKFLSRVHRFSSAFAYLGGYRGDIGGRRAFIDGEYVYWQHMNGGIQAGDPLLTDPNMSGFGIGSGIGKWSITADPADPLANTGTFDHDSAKPIIAETTIGIADTGSRIHDIIEVTSAQATHVTPGIWVLIQIGNFPAASDDMWILRVTEQATFYRVEEAIDLNFSVDDTDDQYALDLIFRDID
ncbi:MAG: hypothetical protein K5880_14075 [Hydrogenophaga sp.]|uniref:hypothetical protein n=1 Tax=Hydrogenophaga sp. TaxID=1904254 RepID=UPI00260AD0E9|nr:hypothetical protein [Hydrogenophaga sp.]MCV0439750.1 hypothetical protein [Hydrogenophaga sp.]